ncbi:(2Fe-2S)-binding protein [Haliangium sp.]|uniref:(2Fe-2S)-binding protein n=1 Tax=Haliangium sp. TaxID=2663208 RepID=UPI003D134014
MKGKIILCRCEDVTLADLLASIAHGYDDIEEVKRYTGFGTGPCQGKECLSLVATLLAEHSGRAPAEVAPFTSRPPMAPTSFAHYAALERLDPGPHRRPGTAPAEDADSADAGDPVAPDPGGP